jgi:hypothetical protein
MTHHNTTNARLANKARRAAICAVALNMAKAMKKRKAAKILKDRVKVYQS